MLVLIALVIALPSASLVPATVVVPVLVGSATVLALVESVLVPATVPVSVLMLLSVLVLAALLSALLSVSVLFVMAVALVSVAVISVIVLVSILLLPPASELLESAPMPVPPASALVTVFMSVSEVTDFEVTGSKGLEV